MLKHKKVDMIKSRLIEVLRTFSKKEFRDFRRWLSSSIHNQRQDIIDLFEYLLRDDYLFSNKLLGKEVIYKSIFNEENFDDAKIRQVMHFLLKSVESYLVYSNYILNETDNALSLAKIFRKRKLKKSFERTIKTIESHQKKSLFRDEDFLYREYHLQLEQYKYYNQELKRVGTFNLQEISDSFDKYFISNKLKQACLMLAHQAVYQTDYNHGLLEITISYIEKSTSLLKIPSIAIYYYIYKTFNDVNEESYFFKLKQQILNFGNLFPKNEIQNIYLLMINHCIKNINAGEKKFISEAWEIHKQGIDEQILLNDGKLSRFIYKNFISIGLMLKLYNEVENAIFKYKDLLKNEYKESYFNFSLSSYYFEKGEYNKAMELLNQYEHDDILINLNAKTMLIKIYYELSEFNVLESLLESMRAYIQRKKELGNRRRTLYKNIIRYTKKLLKVNPYSKSQKEKLKSEIEAAKPLTEKAWLLKQLEEL